MIPATAQANTGSVRQITTVVSTSEPATQATPQVSAARGG